jgi:hypothetical protein
VGSLEMVEEKRFFIRFALNKTASGKLAEYCFFKPDCFISLASHSSFFLDV